jgi:hypothetical protein
MDAHIRLEWHRWWRWGLGLNRLRTFGTIMANAQWATFPIDIEICITARPSKIDLAARLFQGSDKLGHKNFARWSHQLGANAPITLEWRFCSG